MGLRQGCTSAQAGNGRCSGGVDCKEKPALEGVETAYADDDGFLCGCCLHFVLEDVLGQTTPPRFLPWERMDQFSSEIRKCCLRWGALCCKSSLLCCSKGKTGQMKAQPSAITSARKEAARETLFLSQTPSKSLPELQPARLLVKRMDCADCAHKVSRTLKQLPTVKVLHLDYFQGIIDIQHDADQIKSEALAHFVARATGFDIVVDDARVSDANTLVIPITFQEPPPSFVIEAYGLEPFHSADDTRWWISHSLQRRKRSSLKRYNLPIIVKGNQARNPRDVLEELQEYFPALEAASEDAARKRVRDDLYHVAARTVLIGTLTIPVLVLVWADLPLAQSTKYGVALALSTAIVALSSSIFTGSIKSLYYIRQADLGLLVTVSVAFSYLFSVVGFGLQAAGKAFAEPFFETVSLLLFLIYLGRAVQASTRRSTGTALHSLRALQCRQVNVVNADGSLNTMDARLLTYHDVLRVGEGERIPTDGLVVNGQADVDESILTGESDPLSKNVFKVVRAGSTVVTGSLDVQTTTLIFENSLAAVASLVERAQASRTRYQDLADRIAAKLLPTALCVSVLASIAWGVASRYARNESISDSAVTGITYAIAVMAVSCPCAIGLAVRTSSEALAHLAD